MPGGGFVLNAASWLPAAVTHVYVLFRILGSRMEITENGSERHANRIQLLRSQVERMDPESVGIDDATLRRFLQAQSLNVDKACKFLVQHQRWRRAFVPHGYISEAEIANELKKQKIFLQGYDKMDRPIGVILAARHETFKRDLEEFKRFVVYGFDKAITSLPCMQEKIVLIADLQGWSYKNMDVKGFIAVLEILQAYYPERLAKVFMIHVPYLFWGCWKLLYPLIDPVVKKKIIFVADKHLQATLFEDIDISQLPCAYGGKLPFVPIQEYGMSSAKSDD